MKISILLVFAVCFFFSCKAEEHLEGVPRSDIYSVSLVENGAEKQLEVFHNRCNKYDPTDPGSDPKDKGPLSLYAEHSVDWSSFTADKEVEVVVEVLDTSKVRLDNVDYRVLPSRKQVIAKRVSGTNKLKFTLPGPGQYSVEIGSEEEWKHALVLFANPPETVIPDFDKGKWLMIKGADHSLDSETGGYDAIWFGPGVHDIGVFNVPANIKQIYIHQDAWVYGAFIMDGKDRSNVKIFGRGVLSGARLHLRESHSVEAINDADGITVKGITIADYVHFAIRLLGQNNRVEWTKIVGGWIYNCDGIAAYAGSKISNCFIWANDDNIKLYDDNITVDKVVCWNLNNGAVFQLSWGGFTSSNVTVRNVDVIRTDYSGEGMNHGIVNCRKGIGGNHRNFLFENVTVETPTNIVINIAPEGRSHPIENFVFRNWNVRMNMKKGIKNKLVGISKSSQIENFSFSNFVINGTCIDENNDSRFFETRRVKNISFGCSDVAQGD
ncbi:hypothetical protein ACT29H_12795 [Thermophagus sp. OGC60D27]|uniref:hypothetical protein n=1 Tax=Thermophagus sp. OGC60D27 TaxID=3458415 RepID=UPI004037F8C1